MFLLFVAIFNSVIGLSVLFPIMGPLGRELGLTETQVGALSMSYALMQFLLATYWGRKSESVGRKPVMLAGIIGFSLTFFGFAFIAQMGLNGALETSTLFILLLCTRLAGGALSSATMPTAQAFAADLTSSEDRTAGMAIIGAAFGLGVIFGPGIGAALSGIDLLAPVYFSASVGALNALFVALVLREPKERQARAPQPLAPVARQVWPLLLTAVAMTLASVAMEQTVAFYFQDKLGLTERETPAMVGVALVIYGVVAVIAQGFIVRKYKFPPRTLLRAGVPISIAGFLLFIFATDIVTLTAALVLQGLGHGLALPGVTAALSLAVDDSQQGAVAGLNSSAHGLGRLIGPLLGTALYEIEPEIPYMMSAGLMALVLVAIIASRPLRSVPGR